MKKLTIISSVALLGVLPGTMKAPTTVVVVKNTATNVCIGPNATCSSSVGGAVGDILESKFDIAKAKPLGKSSKGVAGVIDVELKDVTLDLPQKPGDEVGYYATPTKGESANEKIFILINNLVEKPGTLQAMGDKQEVKIYRRFAKDPANKWTEVGNFGPPKEFIGEIGNSKVTLRSDGTVIWKNPVTGEEKIFLVAKKILKEDKPEEAKA